MKLLYEIWERIFRSPDAASVYAKNRERFVTGVIRTESFRKLSLQDKVLALGRLVILFRKDFGFSPEILDQAVESMGEKLRQAEIKAWEENYAQTTTTNNGRPK